MIASWPRRIAERLGVRVPSDRVEIAWRAGPDAETDPFRTYPAQIVKVLNPEFFRDKVVLIGSNFSITDRHRTPFAAAFEGPKGVLPGVVIQAHSLAQLLEGRSPDRPAFLVNFGVTCLLALFGALIGGVERPFVYTAALGLFIVGLFWINAFVLFHSTRVLIELLPPSFALMATSWITESLSGQEARRQRRIHSPVLFPIRALDGGPRTHPGTGTPVPAGSAPGIVNDVYGRHRVYDAIRGTGCSEARRTGQ